ncbi:ribonuclease E/G [Oceanibaculum nanhaiense]|uniref:ribonuclease E/G n=1 Tax=Oceanibaculum nanhaiense TaxID=1909734 RepID=UPI00397640A2
MRDIYDSEIEEVLLEGDEGYKSAKTFMKDLIPSHAKKVQQYKDPVIPLFQRYQVESQLDAIHSPTVQLKSGGYIVMNQTEALVAIDVNSGRSTRERNIEETAYRTNLEAAEEVARQLRLRDLSGLIVIDFIDMEENRNQQAVERKLKESMKNDRARIQIGRISHFGLLELSRQRLRPSVFETANQPCPHCAGTGYIRSTDTTALHVLRAIEEEGIRQRASEIAVYVPTQIALYILNQKRAALALIEARYSFEVIIGSDDTLIPPAFRLERVRQRSAEEQAALEAAAPARIEAPVEIDEDEDEIEESVVQSDAVDAEDGPRDGAQDDTQDGEAREGRRRRRRRPGRGGRDGEPRQLVSDDQADSVDSDDDAPADAESESTGEPHAGEPLSAEEEERQRKRRRRGRRGGRRRRRTQEEQDSLAASGEATESDADTYADKDTGTDAATEAQPAAEPTDAEKPKRSRRGRGRAATQETVEVVAGEVTAEAAPAMAAEAAPEGVTETEAPAKPKRPSRRKPKAEAAAAVTDEAVTAEAVTPEGVTVEVITPESAAAPEAGGQKPKPAPRKRAPRKVAASTETVEAEKPKRARAPRKPKAPAAAETVDAAAAETAASPVVETIVVKAEPAAAKQPEGEPDKPAKRGWWSRAVGR